MQRRIQRPAQAESSPQGHPEVDDQPAAAVAEPSAVPSPAVAAPTMQAFLLTTRPQPPGLLPLMDLWLELVPHPLVAPVLRHDPAVVSVLQQQVVNLSHLATMVHGCLQLWRAKAEGPSQGPRVQQAVEIAERQLEEWQGVSEQVVATAAMFASVAQHSPASKLQREQGPPACWQAPKWLSVQDVLQRAQRQAEVVLASGCPVEGEEDEEMRLLSIQEEQMYMAQHLANLMELVNQLLPPALTSDDFQRSAQCCAWASGCAATETWTQQSSAAACGMA